jgi:hypothetical protein
VYDGSDIVEEFTDFGIFKLGGEFLRARNSKDINPEAPPQNHESFGNTFQLTKSHRVLSVIGISFYACAFGRQPDPKFTQFKKRFSLCRQPVASSLWKMTSSLELSQSWKGS